MDGIFFVKAVGQPQTIQGKNGENLAKLNIVLSTKECRFGDNGTYAVDQDFAIDLIGDRATGFNVPQSSWIAASISSVAREYNGSFFAENRLNRYVKL